VLHKRGSDEKTLLLKKSMSLAWCKAFIPWRGGAKKKGKEKEVIWKKMRILGNFYRNFLA